MNLQEIRVSGLLEQYVIGALNADDKALVVSTISEYPQLKKDITLIRDVLRSYHNMPSTSLPAELKSQVLTAYQNVSPQNPSRTISRPTPTAVRKSSKSTSKNQVPWSLISGGLAALFALGCIAIFFLDRSKINRYENEIAQLESSGMSKDIQINKLTAQRDSLSVLSDPNNEWSSLKPNYRFPDAQAYVIKNIANNSSYAKINQLPELPAGRSHQLWIQDATGVYEQLPVSIESLSTGFMNPIDIPIKAVRLVISIHRDNTEYLPSVRTIVGTIEL